MTSHIYISTAGTLTVTGLTQQPAGTLITGATVTGVLKDAAGLPVEGWTGLVFSDAGSGNYTYAFTAAQVPSLGTYSLTVTAVKSGVTFTVEHDVVVQLLTT